MNRDLNTELGYVLMDLDSIRAYIELIQQAESKIIDRLSCIRMELFKDDSDEYIRHI